MYCLIQPVFYKNCRKFQAALRNAQGCRADPTHRIKKQFCIDPVLAVAAVLAVRAGMSGIAQARKKNRPAAGR